MGKKMKKAQGRIKQAAGSLTGDKELRREGERDETKGKVQGAVDDAGDAVKRQVSHTQKAIKRRAK